MPVNSVCAVLPFWSVALTVCVLPFGSFRFIVKAIPENEPRLSVVTVAGVVNWIMLSTLAEIIEFAEKPVPEMIIGVCPLWGPLDGVITILGFTVNCVVIVLTPSLALTVWAPA